MKYDLVLTHCSLINVLSAEIERDITIAIRGERIVSVSRDLPADGSACFDVGGAYVSPSLIDAHIHLESTKLTVREAARAMSRFGTCAVVTDPHEIANVCGLQGIIFQMECARRSGYIDTFFTAPSCVPSLPDPSIETFGHELTSKELAHLVTHPEVVALGEMMNVPGVLMKVPDVERKIAMFREAGRRIDGHAPMLSGKTLQACIAAGIDSDHESTTADEALEKVRRGMKVMVREGSSERNLDALLPVITADNSHQFMFASDDLDPSDLLSRGHINHLVARAVAAGMPPVRALQLATVNPARHFRIDRDFGAIVPGALANIAIFPDLIGFVPVHVIHRGHFVLRDCVECPQPDAGLPELPCAMSVRLPESAGALAVHDEGRRTAVAIDLVPHQIVTGECRFEPTIVGGCACPRPELGIAKVCVFERHRNSGAFGTAFVRGFGIRRGAIGSSVGHDSHNIIVVGMDDADMLQCARTISGMGGGQAAVLAERSAVLPLPIAGLMSPESAAEVCAAERDLDSFAERELGVLLSRPFAALSFMSLPVIPLLRITDQGLFRVEPGAYPKKISILE